MLALEFIKTVENVANFKPGLYAGTTTQELLSVEKEMGISLPQSFKEFYLEIDGQDSMAEFLFDNFYLCPIKNIVEYWKALRDLEDIFSDIDVEAQKGVKNVWCCKEWMPFASTADGNFLCLDFAPTQDGLAGQIITVWHNSPEREVVASSFESFIEDYISNIKHRIYCYYHGRGIVQTDGNYMF